MAAERKSRRFTTYGSVANKTEYQSAAPQRRGPERNPRPRVKPRERTVARPRVQVRPQEAIAPVAILGFAAVLLCAVLLVMSGAQLAMVKDETNTLRTQMRQLEQEEDFLLAKYEVTFDLKAIEAQFTADGSMVKAGPGQVVYLDLSEGDQVVYYDAAEQGLSGLVRKAEQFLSNLLPGAGG